MGCSVITYFPYKTWRHGVFALLLLWVGYLYWLPLLIHSELGLGWPVTISVVIGLVLYVLIVMSGLLYGIGRFTNRSIALWVTIFWMVSSSVPFLSFTNGFTLINPVLPVLVWARAFLVTAVPANTWRLVFDSRSVYYVPPPQITTRQALAQAIYKTLHEVPSPPTNQAYIVMPESTFPYSITPESDELMLWRSALPADTTLIMGGIFLNKDKKKQALFFISKWPITAIYEKRTAVDFFEADLCATPAQTPYVGEWQIVMCSDLFLPLTAEKPVLCCVNESWLPYWLQQLWKGYGIWRSRVSGVPLLWVGHTDCFMVKTNI